MIGLIRLGILVVLPVATAHQTRPQPTHADIRYGDYERNVFGLYLAPSATPTPLVIYIHGEGFRAGDKKGVSPKMVRLLNKAGISVASLNYPLTDTAHFPRQMHDPARAAQFIRHNAAKWNLEPQRFGATGGSAGVGISLWIGFHDDMADPSSDYPGGRVKVWPRDQIGEDIAAFFVRHLTGS